MAAPPAWPVETFALALKVFNRFTVFINFQISIKILNLNIQTFIISYTYQTRGSILSYQRDYGNLPSILAVDTLLLADYEINSKTIL